VGDLSGEKARRVTLWGLYRTAWHLHRAYYGEEGLRAVREEIELLLARGLRERWEFDLLQAESLAAEVLHFWEGAGLLDVYRLVGQKWLAFRHLTFQEYGTAQALAKTYEDDADGLWQCLSPYLLRPQWAGVIPLTLAHLSRAQSTILVKRLLLANEGDKDRQRPLFLTAAALAEGAEVADALHRQVVDGLVRLARTKGWWEVWTRASAADAIRALGRLVGDGYATARLLSLALAQDKAVDDQVRVGAAEALSTLGRADEAVELLLALAHDRAVGVRVREAAAEALGRLGRADEAAELLLALARDRAAEASVRGLAAAALGRLGQADEAAEFLLALIRDSTPMDPWVQGFALAALGELGRADDLLALAWDSAVETPVRVQAARALGELGRTEELLALAWDETVEVGVRGLAAVAPGRLGQADEATEFLLALIRDPTPMYRWVRGLALVALRELGRADDLLALARDEAVEALVQVGAAAALGLLGRADEAAELLLALARDEAVEAWVRERSAKALGRLGRATPEVLIGLRALAEEPWTSETLRWAARRALERLAE
jgi:tetratricopeptide (TPR) repeat protein